MGRAEIRTGQSFRVFGIAAQLMQHGHDFRTGIVAHGIGQAKAADQTDLLQCRVALDLGTVRHAPLEGRNDGVRRMAAHCQNERKAEARAVLGIQLVQARELLWRAVAETCTALLASRLRGQLVANGCLARQVRMRADQCQLLIRCSSLDHRAQGLQQLQRRRKRT